jgi:hypothetical protein
MVFSDSFVKSAVGLKKHNGVKYQTTAQRISGLIPPGSHGVNHSKWFRLEPCPQSCCLLGYPIDIPIDGVVVLLTITIVS